jgi:hypothetical protein
MGERAEALKYDIKHFGSKTLKIGAAMTAAYVFFAPSKLNAVSVLPGSFGHKISNAEASKKAMKTYNEVYAKSSPAKRFSLQYLATPQVVIHDRPGESGILAAIHEGSAGEIGSYFKRIVRINNSCLKNTAFDIQGGEVHGSVSGFASGNVDGNVPTAAAEAYVDSENPDELMVRSGNPVPTVLRFSGAKFGNKLIPLDKVTRDVLATNGCESGVTQQISGGNAFDQNSTI